MLLFYDTETTGFIDKYLPLDHPKQPYAVQIAALLCEENGTEKMQMNCILCHPNIEVPKAASDVHGITTEEMVRLGVDPKVGFSYLSALAKKATLLIAHNIEYDFQVVRTQFSRWHYEPNSFLVLKQFCTMLATTDICKLPGKYGKYKWPKLQEAYVHFFGEEFQGAHDALADVRACKRIYFHLLEKGYL